MSQAQARQIKIPTKAWKATEQIACKVMSVIAKYSGVEVEVSRDVDYETEGNRFKWIEGAGASIEVKGNAPVEPVRNLLRNNGFRLIDTISNTITEENDYKEWEVGEKWEKVVRTSDGVTITIQVDLGYMESSRGAASLSSVFIYPIMNVQRKRN